MKAAGADWLVGSEEVEPGEGWNYNDFLGRVSNLFDGGKTDVSAADVAHAIVDSYAAGPSDNSTMSATDLSHLDAFNGALDGFSDALMQAGGLQNQSLRKAYEQTLRFDDADQMDIGDFAKKVIASTTDVNLKAAANTLLEAMTDTTTEKQAAGAKKYANATGLTVYAPTGSIDSQYQSDGKDLWSQSHWNQVIASYSNKSSAV